MINNRRKSSITDTSIRTFRGADIGSDHYLLIAKLKERISVVKTNKSLVNKINIEQLKIPEKQMEYMQKLEQILETNKQNTEVGMNVEQQWSLIKESVLEAAKCLGLKQYKRKEWFDEECKSINEEQKEAKRIALNSPTTENKEKYKELRRKSKKIMRQKKRKLEQEKLDQLEDNRRTNNIRDFHQETQRIRTGFVPKSDIVYDKEGQPICAIPKIIKRWEEYFQNLLNTEPPEIEETNIYTAELECHPPSRQEILFAIKRLKNNKSPGSDGIPSELHI